MKQALICLQDLEKLNVNTAMEKIIRTNKQLLILGAHLARKVCKYFYDRNFYDETFLNNFYVENFENE